MLEEEDAAVDGLALSLASFCDDVVDAVVSVVVSVFVGVAGSVKLCLSVFSVLEEFLFEIPKLVLLLVFFVFSVLSVFSV